MLKSKLHANENIQETKHNETLIHLYNHMNVNVQVVNNHKIFTANRS